MQSSRTPWHWKLPSTIAQPYHPEIKSCLPAGCHPLLKVLSHVAMLSLVEVKIQNTVAKKSTPVASEHWFWVWTFHTCMHTDVSLLSFLILRRIMFASDIYIGLIHIGCCGQFKHWTVRVYPSVICDVKRVTILGKLGKSEPWKSEFLGLKHIGVSEIV